MKFQKALPFVVLGLAFLFCSADLSHARGNSVEQNKTQQATVKKPRSSIASSRKNKNSVARSSKKRSQQVLRKIQKKLPKNKKQFALLQSKLFLKKAVKSRMTMAKWKKLTTAQRKVWTLYAVRVKAMLAKSMRRDGMLMGQYSSQSEHLEARIPTSSIYAGAPWLDLLFSHATNVAMAEDLASGEIYCPDQMQRLETEKDQQMCIYGLKLKVPQLQVIGGDEKLMCPGAGTEACSENPSTPGTPGVKCADYGFDICVDKNLQTLSKMCADKIEERIASGDSVKGLADDGRLCDVLYDLIKIEEYCERPLVGALPLSVARQEFNANNPSLQPLDESPYESLKRRQADTCEQAIRARNALHENLGIDKDKIAAAFAPGTTDLSNSCVQSGKMPFQLDPNEANQAGALDAQFSPLEIGGDTALLNNLKTAVNESLGSSDVSIENQSTIQVFIPKAQNSSNQGVWIVPVAVKDTGIVWCHRNSGLMGPSVSNPWSCLAPDAGSTLISSVDFKNREEALKNIIIGVGPVQAQPRELGGGRTMPLSIYREGASMDLGEILSLIPTLANGSSNPNIELEAGTMDLKLSNDDASPYTKLTSFSSACAGELRSATNDTGGSTDSTPVLPDPVPGSSTQ